MKVTGFRTFPYRFELNRKLGDVNFPAGRKNWAAMALFLDTDEGLTGVAPTGPGARDAIHSLEPLIIGQDPRGVRGLWKKMVDHVFKGGNEGVINDAISSIDVALWDLKAKANNEPLWRTLGASEGKVKAYASGLDMPLSDDELRAFYQSMADRGVSAGKLKVGVDQDADLRRLGIMCDVLRKNSNRPNLMIDSNEYWSPKQAIRKITEMERYFDLTWVEEPARRWDYRGLRQVSEGVKAAVATGENLADIGEFMGLIDNRAVDIVEVGVGTTGITGAMQVADMAYGYELPVAMMNCPAHFMSHLAAALPNHIMMECVEPGWDVCFTYDTHIEGGYILIGDKPGIGIEYDMEKLKKLSTQKVTDDMKMVIPGRRRGAALYDVPFDPAIDK